MFKQMSWSRIRLWSLSVILATLIVAAVPYQGGMLPASTPTLVQVWSGRIVSVVEDLSLRGSVLRVSVLGLKDLPVKIRTADGNWSIVGLTGSKSEFGEYMVEFAALSRGDYVIEPQGLGVSLPFYSNTTSYVTVEFAKGPVANPTATSSPSPAPPTPSATLIPTSIPRPTEMATFTPLPPTPTLTPIATSTSSPTITAAPPAALPVDVVYQGRTPAPLTMWSGRIAYTIRENVLGTGAIVVRVLGQVGLPVELKIGGFQAQAMTGSKPEYGSFACEFGGLGPGLYTISPQGLDSTVSVDLQQGEFVMVEFSPLTVPGISATATPAMMVALVVSTPIVQPTATWLSPSPTTPLATATLSPEVGVNVSLSNVFSPTEPVVMTSLKPIWKAQVTQRASGTGYGPASLVVRVLGARNLPVALRADGWQTSAETGTKLEYGDFACEFGGLTSGEYEIAPDGMELSHKLEIASGEFVLVDFFYETPKLPDVPALAIPAAGADDGGRVWSGRVFSQTIEAGNVVPGGTDWGTVVVQILDTETLAVEMRSADGWSAFTLTEIKPELEGSVAEFVRLSPGVYQVVPQGLGAWIQMNVVKGSHTWVEFASR